MGSNNGSARWAAAALALILLSAAPAATAEEAEAALENGVTWNTTLQQVMDAEGMTETGQLESYTGKGYIQYGLSRRNGEGDLQEYISYTFVGDRLVMVGCSFDLYAMPDGTKIEDVFNAQRTRLSGLYGEPSTGDRQRLIRLLDALEEGMVSQEDIPQFTGWKLDNGPELYLLKTFGDSVFYLYVNAAELVGK